MDRDPSSASAWAHTPPDSNAQSATSASSTSSPPESSPPAQSAPSSNQAMALPAKRSRATLSCGPCRLSKLRCDRGAPCLQCHRKGRPDGCLYAPKPVRQKIVPKGVATRLRRLEGLVRTLIEQEGAAPGAAVAEAAAAVGISMSRPPPAGPATKEHLLEPSPPPAPAPAPVQTWNMSSPATTATRDEAARAGQVVVGNSGATYVGATHFLAMLKDIEELKNCLEDPEDDGDAAPDLAVDDLDPPSLLLLQEARGPPRTKEDFLELLPDRLMTDRLIKRYFAAYAPASYIIHRPAFSREYSRFWQNPPEVSLHWLAQLFMMLAMGVFYGLSSAPLELETESPLPPMERFRRYRAVAGWILIAARYMQPRSATMTALQLYIEAEMVAPRTGGQMYCYVLTGVCLRLMLRMGMHRDPDHLPNISAFEGEMRRRQWAVAVQVDLLLGFHLGLPAIIHGIDSDTKLPHNYLDEDFDEDSLRLPQPRPFADYTPMTYAVSKGSLIRVFGQVARLASNITPPRFAEVLEIDDDLESIWRWVVPECMKPRPPDECVADPPFLLVQRFGLATLYNKSRCVLHRAYIVESPPLPEHDVSRRRCLEAALNLMDFQAMIWDAAQPGKALHPSGWIFKSLTMHDFLLAAMVLCLVLQQAGDADGAATPAWRLQPAPLPALAEILAVLKRARSIWRDLSRVHVEMGKASALMDIMLDRLGVPRHDGPSPASTSVDTLGTPGSYVDTSAATITTDPAMFTGLSLDDQPQRAGKIEPPVLLDPLQGSVSYPGSALDFPTDAALDSSWATLGADLDWRQIDNVLSQPAMRVGAQLDQDWLADGPPITDFESIYSATNWTTGFPRTG